MVLAHVISKIWIGSTGEPKDFEWKNSTGFTTVEILDEIQKMMTKSKCEPEQFKGKIIFMSMYNDIDWTKRGNKENCLAKALKNAEYASKIPARTLVGSRVWIREEWRGTHLTTPDGEWDKTAEGMMLNFADRGHPIFRATSALERGDLKSKGKGRKSVYFNGSDETIDLILRTIVSVIELSVYGAGADLCTGLARNSRGTGKPAANENLGSMVIPTEFPTANAISQTDADVQGNLLRIQPEIRRTS